MLLNGTDKASSGVAYETTYTVFALRYKLLRSLHQASPEKITTDKEEIKKLKLNNPVENETSVMNLETGNIRYVEALKLHSIKQQPSYFIEGNHLPP